MKFIETLGVNEENFGACSGPNKWNKTKDQGKISSVNPANNKLISSVYKSSISDYNQIGTKRYCPLL